MKLQIHDTYAAMSAAAAALVMDTLRAKPTALLCFATGDTPRLTYELLAARIQEEKVDTSQCTLIGLDEWLGIPPENEGSCDYFLHHYLINPLGLKPRQVHLFDGLSDDLENECAMMNGLISDKGGIDLALVGVGMNGHIGFNEPGTPVDAAAHVSALEPITTQVGQKYFMGEQPLHSGLTVGLKQLLEAGQLIMIANGEKKAPVLRQMMEGEISNLFPASLLRQQVNGFLLTDSAAATMLTTQKE